MQYITRHWQGGFSLSYAFWVNFIGVGLFAYSVPSLLQIMLDDVRDRLFYTSASLFILFWFFIYPWQVVGVIRSSERNPGKLRHSLWILPIQGLLLLSSVMFFTGTVSLVQLGYSVFHQQQKDERFMEIFFGDPEYELAISEDGRQLAIDGLIDNGLTKDVRNILEQYPGVQIIRLRSEGGSIYEARGVARLIMERALDTYVETECSSGCTTIFMAGNRRLLAEEARLGFHQYRFDATYFLPDQEESIAEEQQRDLEFLRARGVRQAFLDRVFATPHDEIWYPSRQELLTMNVINQAKLQD